jgi:hypothetical protein
MPKDVTSPFTPGLPVPVEFFVGRVEEIRHLQQKAGRARGGHLQVAFMVGERGIGKSSLASFSRYLVEREDRMIGLHAFLGGVTTLEEMVRRMFDRLVKEAVGKPWYERLASFFEGHIHEVGMFGVSVEFGAPKEDLVRLVSSP